MQIDYTLQLREILANTRKIIPNSEFCGIGVVLYSDFDSLPVLPLCPKQVINAENSLGKQLANASLYSNPCHDGFHLISEKFVLTHINQFFSPPLPLEKSVHTEPTAHLGARYVSAQIGSMMSCIHCTGIISEKNNLIIFRNGKEVR